MNVSLFFASLISVFLQMALGEWKNNFTLLENKIEQS